ncbi:MAG TPA: phosphate ABC transporter permease subunit PstC [Bdellovibrionales bacterium]|nr:phosphate ABC transporter permease subunit PstC [Bdellovibrionales bacterium]
MRRDYHIQDRLFQAGLRTFGLGIIALLIAIVALLMNLSWPAWKQFGLGFLTGTNWDPVAEQFGAGALIYGTVVSSLLALLIATPISVAVGLYLAEVAYTPLSKILGFLVEMLAAIPSVVYGLWGIFVLAPWLRTSVQPWLGEYFGFLPLFQGPPYGVGMMAAGIILAIMITPTISTICREVFKAIPRNQREAALGLGATHWEMLRLAVLKNSRSGIFGAVILGLGRALGETMAVTMVIGNRPEISASLFAPSQSMASMIANEYNEASNQIHLSSLAAVGLSLFLVSLTINAFARIVIASNTRGAKRK